MCDGNRNKGNKFIVVFPFDDGSINMRACVDEVMMKLMSSPCVCVCSEGGGVGMCHGCYDWVGLNRVNSHTVVSALHPSRSIHQL